MADERRAEDPRIGQILGLLEGQEKLFDTKLEPINKMLAVHDRTLFGDGSEGNQGLRVDVHDLKTGAKRKNWILSIMATPVLAGIGMKIWDWIRTH